jgi:hypothetical protein
VGGVMSAENSEVSLGEVARGLKEVKDALRDMGKILNAIAPVWQMEMDPERPGSIAHRTFTLESRVTELERDTFSKRQVVGLLTTLALLAAGVAALIGVLHP